MKTSPLCAVLLALALPLAAQKMATPAGEAPGPWILGTIGVGRTEDPKVPKTTALKGLAIKVGENGEAAVAYDLDLCRMVGAWTGPFTTPMNLMSRGEYPTAMGEVAFTTGEVPGFLLGAGTAEGKNGGLQSKSPNPAPRGENPVPRGIDLPPRGIDPAPQTGLPAPHGDDPEGRGTGIAPQKTHPAPQEKADGRRGDDPAGQKTLPAAQNNPLATRDNDPAGQNHPLKTGENAPAAPQNLPAGWPDPRPEPFGPLPEGQARFKGFYVNGAKTILKWDIGGTEVLEMPGLIKKGQSTWFVRHFEIGAITKSLAISVPPVGKDGLESDIIGVRGATTVSVRDPGSQRAESMHWRSAPQISRLFRSGEDTFLEIGPSAKPMTLSVAILAPADRADEPNARRVSGPPADEWPDLETTPDLRALTKGGPARWPETVTTAGEVSAKTDEAYVVDTIKLPDPNPWGAPMFVGGFDFFDHGKRQKRPEGDGAIVGQAPRLPAAEAGGAPALQSTAGAPLSAKWDAAVCTFHGDVFVVSGIDAKLEQVTWKRFASGLYHALGLKIVNGEIYVTGRDGLWRLKDLNGDGECDFYEAFNFDLKVTKNFHEFVFDLQTDPAGNFYYAKAGPVKNGGRGFDQIMAHHGALLRVSPDGAKLDVVATGFRAPNGIGCGPDGQLTSGDNEGTWTPACKINWIKPGGFYGVVPLSHGFRGIRSEADLSTINDQPSTPSYDRPLCWLPKRVDNSGGSQVWVPPGEKWGPWGGQMLHLSYGTCSVFGVMREEIVGQAPRLPVAAGGAPALQTDRAVMQGGVVRFPVNFQSGIMRARFNPVDGQLYVGGLRGWQTTGVKNGAFQRVRYTGAPVRMPIGLHATTKGVRLDFTCRLDPATANDAQNWNVEVWNYLWSSAYGSPELSTLEATEKPAELGKDGEPQFTRAQVAQKKHDPLTVKSATLSAHGKSIFLEIPDIKPVMQMAIKFGIQSADGAELRSEVVNTIHALAAE